MHIDAVCPTCANPLTFLAEQVGDNAVCMLCGEALIVTPAEPGQPAPFLVSTVPDPVTQSVGKEALELGPRWRGVARALRWVRLAYGVWLVLLPCLLVASVLPVRANQYAGLPGIVPVMGLFFLTFCCLGCMYAVALFVGRVSCLRVPAGIRCRSFVASSLIATLVGPAFTVVGGAVSLVRSNSREFELLSAE